MATQTTEAIPPPKALRQNRSQEIVFIDAGIENYALLAAGVVAGPEVVVISVEQDGIEQITKVLRKRRELTCIHLVCLGSIGQLQLGSGLLSLNSLERYVWDLAIWSNALSANAELLIYGSEVAKGIRGEEFINYLGQVIEIPIAASCSKTGSSALAGNWDLEYSTLPCTTSIAFNQQTISQYGHLL
ncbi:MAG: DUF4347 domain-containing protein [Elainella sp.]